MADIDNSSTGAADAVRMRGRSARFPAHNGYFYIKSKLNGLVMGVEGGQKYGMVKMYPKTNEDSQKWAWDRRGRMIVNYLVHRWGWALSVSGPESEPGRYLEAGKRISKNWTRWKILQGDLIVNRKSDLVVAVDNGSTASGTKVVIMPVSGFSSQKWEFEPIE